VSVVHALRYRLSVLRRALFDRRGWRREMDAELGFHLALEEMQQRHAGATPDEARRTARQRLGDPARVRERLVDDSGASPSARCARAPASRWWPCSRSPSGSVPASRSSAPSTRCCCGACRSPTRRR
jgi:hypothetical protein